MTKIKSKKYEHVFSYTDTKGIKLWGFRYRYYDALGKRREKAKQGFPKEMDAYRGVLEIQTQLVNGSSKQVENSSLTIAEWLDIWFETHKGDWAVSSLRQRENAIKYQMKPLLGHYRLADLDKSTYKREYLNVLLKKYKPNTVKLFHRLFKIAINAAVDDEIIPRNRFSKVVLPDEGINENYYSAEELRKFLKVAEETENITNYTFICLLAYTGMRRGEVQGLQWEDIDFERKTLSVYRTRDHNGVRKPKTKRSRRTIKLDDLVLYHLKVYRTWCKKTMLTFGMKLQEDSFIFISHQNGTAIGDNTIKYAFERTINHAGLKFITPHGLRHTHATLLIQARIPVPTIAEKLGNTVQMIHDVYGHALKEVEQESVDTFSKIMNAQ